MKLYIDISPPRYCKYCNMDATTVRDIYDQCDHSGKKTITQILETAKMLGIEIHLNSGEKND